MLIKKSVKAYCDEVDSELPAPGGGSVAALVGSLAVSLSRMYAHLTISKKAFQQLNITSQNQFLDAFTKLEHGKQRLLELVDEDALLYPKILAAYRLPKTTDEEIIIRKQAIQEATILGIEGPYEIAKVAYDALLQTEQLLPFGNKNVVSDAACAILLLETTIETAIINMEINLVSLSNQETIQKYTGAITTLRKQTKEKKEQLMAIAHPLYRG